VVIKPPLGARDGTYREVRVDPPVMDLAWPKPPEPWSGNPISTMTHDGPVKLHAPFGIRSKLSALKGEGERPDGKSVGPVKDRPPFLSRSIISGDHLRRPADATRKQLKRSRESLAEPPVGDEETEEVRG